MHDMMDFAESCEIYMFDQSLSSLLHWNDPEDIFDGMKWIFLVSDSYRGLQEGKRSGLERVWPQGLPRLGLVAFALVPRADVGWSL